MADFRRRTWPAVGILAFIMWKIVPVFDKMFQEFGLKLPAPTVLLINMSRWVLQHGWWMIPLVAMLLIIAALVAFASATAIAPFIYPLI